MALTPWIRRLAFGAIADEISAEEASLYAVGERMEAEEGRMLMVVWSRPDVAGGQDKMITTHHFINTTGGVVDETWIDADFAAIETGFDAYWSDLRTYASNVVVLDQYRWYKFSAALEVPGVVNPPVRITEKSSAGTSTGVSAPHQVAVSVTEKTAVRRSWGRFYLPLFASTILGSGGLIDATAQDVIANGAATWLEDCFDNDYLPVVWSPTKKHAYSVEKIQVDNLFDVIRRRRFDAPTVRVIRPIPS